MSQRRDQHFSHTKEVGLSAAQMLRISVKFANAHASKQHAFMQMHTHRERIFARSQH